MKRKTYKVVCETHDGQRYFTNHKLRIASKRSAIVSVLNKRKTNETTHAWLVANTNITPEQEKDFDRKYFVFTKK